MKKFKLIPILLIICVCMSIGAPSAAALEDPNISAKAAVLIDLNSGSVLYDLNKDEQRAPASLTKVMTALLALEAVDKGTLSMDTVITAQPDCRSGMAEDSSTSGIQPGAQLTLEELLYCALLQSANEACNIIGTHIAGSIDGFVAMMNERAAQLGCVNTNFVTTNGLSADGHYSSAYDLALITQEAIKHPEFLPMCNTLSYEPSSAAVNGGETIHNSNALLHHSDYYTGDYVYEYASGVKTGYTRAAGYCLISTAEKNGVHVLAVVLGCDGYLNAGLNEYRNFQASIDLYNWAFDSFAYRTAINKNEVVREVDIQLAKDEAKAVLKPQNNVELLLPVDVTDEDITVSVSLHQEKLVAPIAQGTVLGEARILVDGVIYGEVKLVNTAAIELSRSEYIKMKLQEVFSNVWVRVLLITVIVLAIIYLALVIRYRTLRRKHLQARRRMEERRRQEQEWLYSQQHYYEDNEPTQMFRSISENEEDDEDYEEMDLSEFFAEDE